MYFFSLGSCWNICSAFVQDFSTSRSVHSFAAGLLGLHGDRGKHPTMHVNIGTHGRHTSCLGAVLVKAFEDPSPLCY